MATRCAGCEVPAAGAEVRFRFRSGRYGYPVACSEMARAPCHWWRTSGPPTAGFTSATCRWGRRGQPEVTEVGPKSQRSARGYRGQPEVTEVSPRSNRSARGYRGQPEVTEVSSRSQRSARSHRGHLEVTVVRRVVQMSFDITTPRVWWMEQQRSYQGYRG